MTKEHLTREQVEQRLRDQESKIAGRIESIESSVPVRSIAKIRKMDVEKILKIGALAGVGMLVGLVFALRRKSTKPVDLEDGLERLSSRISDSIRKELDSGKDPEEAVRKALGKTPPILNLQETERSFFGEALRLFSRGVARELARSGSIKLIRKLGLKDEDPDEEEGAGASKKTSAKNADSG